MLRTLAILALLATAQTAQAEAICPQPLAPAPALSAMGPYQQITEGGVTTVPFLPDCATVNWQLSQLSEASQYEVIAEPDGTLTLIVIN